VEDQRNIVLQLGSIPFDQHPIVAATLHDAFGEGALGEQGIHGDAPSLHDQPAPHGLQDWDRMGLVSHGWLPQGQSQPVTEHGEQMGGRRTWPTPRTNRVTTSWLFVIFGEHQVMAQLIAKRVLIALLINKDFPVRHPLLARGNFASVNLNHQQ
jgi:hypothetical protein